MRGENGHSVVLVGFFVWSSSLDARPIAPHPVAYHRVPHIAEGKLRLCWWGLDHTPWSCSVHCDHPSQSGAIAIQMLCCECECVCMIANVLVPFKVFVDDGTSEVMGSFVWGDGNVLSTPARPPAKLPSACLKRNATARLTPCLGLQAGVCRSIAQDLNVLLFFLPLAHSHGRFH